METCATSFVSGAENQFDNKWVCMLLNIGRRRELNIVCFEQLEYTIPGHTPAAVGDELLDDRRGAALRGNRVALVQNLGCKIKGVS